MNTQNECPQTVRLIDQLLSGTNTADLHMDEHLRECPVCQAVYRQFNHDLQEWTKPDINFPKLSPSLLMVHEPRPLSLIKHPVVRGLGLAAASVVAGLLISNALLSEEPASAHQELAMDYTLMLNTDNAFPVEFFNE